VTLQSYSSDEMDEFAVRLFDISAQLRGISKDMRINQIDRFMINDKKALLMCEHLEIWAQKTRNNFDLELMRISNKK